MGGTSTELTRADRLVSGLTKTYEQYEADFSALKRKKGVGGVLLGFLNGNSLAKDPIHEQFTRQVGSITQKLAEALAEEEEGSRWADEAADILLRPKPSHGQDAADWTKIAAELFVEPLLPYLSRARLERALEEYKKAYRTMLPNQSKLAGAMEAELNQR